MSMPRTALLRSSRPAMRVSRSSQPAQRRTASSTTEAAEKAKATADKAADGAKNYINQASEAGGKVLGSVQQGANRLLGSYREPIVHNLSVVKEIAKQVYIKEKLAPPTNPQEIRAAYEEVFSKARDASWWRSTVESGEWKRIAIYAIEAYGIFTIGEMIGRRHIVGYKIEH